MQKQTIHKKLSKSVDYKVLASAMKSKLSDACSYAKRLRQQKNTLKSRVTRKYLNNKSKSKRIIDDMVKRYRKLKILEYEKADKKIQLCKNKNELEKSLREAPAHTGEILAGVNLFSEVQGDLSPEEPLGPFICDKNLVFSKNELKLLSRGPKFMVRSDLSVEDFDVELEKMVVKKRLKI